MLAIEPVDEVKSLRYNHDHFADIALSANEEFVLDGWEANPSNSA